MRLNELPEGWEYKPLAEFVDSLESGARPRGGVSKYTFGVPSISAEQKAEDGRFRWDNIRYVLEEFYESTTKGRIARNDILVVKDGATTGTCGFVGTDFPYKRAMANEHTFRLRTTRRLLPRFAYFYLKSPYCGDYFTHCRARGVIGGLTTSFVYDILVPVPPLAEQRRIVARIEELTSRLRRAADLHREAERDSARLFQAGLESAFSLRQIADWPTYEARQLFTPVNGQVDPQGDCTTSQFPRRTCSR